MLLVCGGESAFFLIAMKNETITPNLLSPQQTNVADIIQRLERCATIVTGNQRLARHLHQIFNQVKISEGRKTWPAPDILPWNAWLQRLWQETIVSGNMPVGKYLLDSHQEQYIWHEILSVRDKDFSMRAADQMVIRIMDAWQTLQAWCVSVEAKDFDYNDDSRLFGGLLSAFETRCRENGWLSLANLPETLLEGFRQAAIPLPSEVGLIGFDELVPQQLSLLRAMAQAGCSPQWLLLSGKSAQVARIACTDSRSEVRLAAHWIRQRLEENPAARIALVVPELTTQREMVCHTLDEALFPRVLQPGCHDLVRPYNLSLGKQLSRLISVSVALDILNFSNTVTELFEVSRLLLSPFIVGWEQEASARALLDARFREIGEWNISLQTLLRHASSKGQPYSCPLLTQSFEELARLAQMRPALASPGAWANWFEQWLKVAGWPGSHTLSSEEYQVIQSWQSLLREFAMLDWVAQPMTLDIALGKLKQMAANTVFQPESMAASVQVLGLLETNGLQFDCLWLMGLHAGVLPMQPRPNPFIPLPLQRQAGMPHSSARRELSVAESLLQRITESANEIIVSYPQRDGDEILTQSPLIDAFPAMNEKLFAMDSRLSWRNIVHRSSRLVVLEDDPAPSLDSRHVVGGSRVFKLQAACPFLAFAELRLGARPLGKVQIGLDAAVRGKLLHRIMEMVWAVLDSWEGLIAMSQDQLKRLIANKVNEAVREIAPRYPQTLGKRLRALEIERLSHLTQAWLELEKNRSPFRVSDREKEAELCLGGVRAHMRIDRIDELACGSKLLIDYKTGLVKPTQWFGERPDEPQLPLYSLIFSDELAGVAFAQVKAGDIAFKGVAREEECAPGISSFKNLAQTCNYVSWSEVLANWRQTLEKLGQDFLAGKADVDPKQYPVTCTYCALKPLCRIDELSEFASARNDSMVGDC